MLVLVVGPSGAGKDTVLALARSALAGDARFRFVRRVITRPAVAGGEDHEAVSDDTFARRSFALQWRAHGLSYGIPQDVTHDLARGIVVVANVSREIIALAANRFPVRVIEVTAPFAVLAARLAARGRETPDDIAQRLARDIPIPRNVPSQKVINDRAPEEAARAMVSALKMELHRNDTDCDHLLAAQANPFR
jgi:phosphonate metabolism protein PhnN/1,5-bisphosphokinase (PRPP-forming)